MNKEDLLNLISDTDEKAFEQFIGANDSKMVIDSSFKSVEYDYSWISKIEDTLVYLDNIIRNPKRFIMQEEEVVPVEKAKKISQETIKHLAQHTDLIQDVEMTFLMDYIFPKPRKTFSTYLPTCLVH